jgi:hypothetical protein
MKKNAQTATLAMIIIVLASSIVIGALIYKISATGNCKTNTEACRFSILAAAKSKKIKGGIPITELKCSRENLQKCDVILKKKDIVEDDKINQDKAHKIIADAMAECWYMVGEGKLDPFSSWDTKGISYCLVCRTIKFDDDLKKFMEESETNPEVAKKRGANAVITSPMLYLRSHDYKGGETYWEYLYNTKDTLTSKDIAEMQKSKFNDNTQILITMYKYKEKSTILYGLAAIAGIVLVVIAGILTATGVGAIIGIPLIKIGAGLAIAGITAIVIFYPLTMDAYSECEDCKGFGGIALVPPEQDLQTEITAKIQNQPVQIPICTFLVN